jgi:hypothetical protein
LDNSLIGNGFELIRSVDKLLPNPVGKLDGSDEIADTEAKAHRDLDDSGSLLCMKESRGIQMVDTLL